MSHENGLTDFCNWGNCLQVAASDGGQGIEIIDTKVGEVVNVLTVSDYASIEAEIRAGGADATNLLRPETNAANVFDGAELSAADLYILAGKMYVATVVVSPVTAFSDLRDL